MCLVRAEATADDCWEEFIKYTFELGSLAMIHIPSFIKICSGIQKLTRGVARINRQHGDCISLLPFFKIRNVG
jgi:hypothetical protein